MSFYLFEDFAQSLEGAITAVADRAFVTFQEAGAGGLVGIFW
jgi:hypothetical protein